MKTIEEYNENSIRGVEAYTEQGETIKAAIHHCPYCKELSTPRNPHTPLHFCPTCGAQTEPVSDELPFDDVKNEKTMTWQTILKAVHTLHDGKTRAVTAEEIEKVRPLYEKVKNEVRGQFGDNPANIAAQVNHILKGRRT